MPSSFSGGFQLENQVFSTARFRDGTFVPRPVVLILGMDRKVVAASLSVAYRDTMSVLRRFKEPNADYFGWDFLDKIVQLTVALPPPDSSAITALLDRVSAGRSPDDRLDVSEQLVSQAVGVYGRRPEDANGELPIAPEQAKAEIRQARGNSNVDDAELDAAIREAGERIRAERLTDADEFKEARRDAADYLQRNPRQIKRFDNAFRLQIRLASRLSDGRDADLRRDLRALGKLVALRMRWPGLADDLDRDPRLLPELEGHANGQAADVAIHTRYRRWFETDALVALLHGPEELRVAGLPGKYVAFV